MERFERSGLVFEVRDGGPADGEPVLLLHGFPEDSTSWSGVEPLLHAAGLRTLAPDQRGYSPGARPQRRSEYSGRALVDDVLALLDQAGLPSAHVVGHDWGGAVAWSLAGLRPDRVRTLTVLSTPHPLALVRSLRSSTQLLRSWYMIFFQLPVLPEKLIQGRVEQLLIKSGLPAPFAAHNARLMREPGALTGALNWYRALPTSLRSPQPRCTVPTTYVWGNRDTFLGRPAAEFTAAAVTGPYRFAELDAGHWLPESNAAEVTALILDRVAQL